MKLCPICGSTYADRVDFCFQDGAPLVAGQAAEPTPEPRAEAPSAETDPTDLPEPREMRSAHELPSTEVAATDLPEPVGLSLPRAAPSAPDGGDLDAAEAPTTQIAPSPAARSPAPRIAQPVRMVSDPARRRPAQAADASEEDLEAPQPIRSPSGAFSSPTLIPDGDLGDGPDEDEQLPAPVPLEDVQPAAPLPPPAADANPDRTFSGEEDDLLDEASFLAGGGDSTGAAVTGTAEPGSEDEDEDDEGGLPWLWIGAVVVVLLGVGAYAAGVFDGPPPAEPPAVAVQTPPPAPAPAPAPAPPPRPEPEPAPPPPVEGADEAVEVPETAPVVEAAAPTPAPSVREPARARPPRPAPEPPAEEPVAAATPVNTEGTNTEGTSGSVWGGGEQAPSKARVTVSSRPAGARITVDGRDFGAAPAQGELDYGTYVFRAEMDGYKPQNRDIAVQSGQIVVPFELQPLVNTGPVTVLGPLDAQLLIDGANAGTLPVNVTLSEGPHSFEVILVDGTKQTKNREVRFAQPGKRVTIDLQ